MARPAKSLIDALQDHAQGRAREAKKRLRFAAQRGALWKILGFFKDRSPAAWGALWYFLISLIGVTYSWAFYFQFNNIHIFDFLDTSDFLLSAFQDVRMLVIGIIATLAGIGILTYRVYDSILYSAYDPYEEERKARVRREAVILLSITLVSIISILFFLLRGGLQVFVNTTLSLIIISISISILAYLILIYCFSKHAYNPISGDKQRDRVNWEVGLLLFMILVGANFIIPLLSGAYDSEAALKEKSHHVRVTLRQGAAQPKIRLSDSVLFLGKTNSFHFFYECAETLTTEDCVGTKASWWDALKNWVLGWWDTQKAENRPEEQVDQEQEAGALIIPSANIAALDFRPQKNEKTDQVGLSDVVTAITDLNETISDLEPIVKIGDITLAASSKTNTEEITKAIKNLRLAINSNPGGLVAATDALSQSIQNLKLGAGPRPGSDKIVAAIDDLSKTVQNLHISVGENYCASGREGTVGIIGPFCKGEYSQLGEIEKECLGQPGRDMQACPDQLAPPDQLVTMDQFFCRMSKHLTDQQTPLHLMLVGRVDNTLFSKEEREFYGTQMKLAKARAEWVRGELLKKFPAQIDSQRIILRVAGPQCTDPEVSECDQALDRSVEVHACWASNDSEQADTPADSPG